MIKFYDAVRYYLDLGMHDDPNDEYEALAIKLLDDVLDKDSGTFASAVDMVVEIAGVDALMRFYDTVATVMPQTAPECKKAARMIIFGAYLDKDGQTRCVADKDI